MPLRYLRLAAVSALVALVLAACGEDANPSEEATPSPRSTPRSQVGAPEPTIEPTPSPTLAAGRVVLALGDSVTFGVGLPDPTTQAFPILLAERLGAIEARVLAVPGETAAGFRDRRMGGAEAAIAEIGDRLELVTIGLGANEILRIRRAPSCIDDRASAECQRIATEAAEEAAAALDAVVVRVRDAIAESGTDAPILLLAYYNPDVEPVATATIVGADGVVDCDPNDPAPGLNDRIACIAERRGTALVDLYSAFLGREDELTGIGTGDVHPTPEGHAVITDAILEVLAGEG